MTPIAGQLQLFALATLGFALLSFAVVGVTTRIHSRRLREVAPDARRRALAILALSPLVSSVACVLACTLPSMIALASGTGDHCHGHEGHPHLCLWHPPDHASAAGWVVLATAGVWWMLRVGGELIALFRDAAALAQITAAPRRQDGAVVLDHDAIVAACVGLVSPVVVISRGLLEQVSPRSVQVILEHERAHARAHDAALLTAVRLLWCALPAWLAAPLLTELALACEEASDHAAADAIGDPLTVADAIIEASRALSNSARLRLPLAVAFETSTTDHRVRRLLEPATRSSALGLRALALYAAVVLLLAEPLHHVAETALSVLGH